MTTDDTLQVESITLVYNADWSVMGALRYVRDMMRGANECALCEITHRTVTEKKAWKSCKAGIGVPVENLYRNSASAALKSVLADEYPAVAAKTDKGYILLLGRAEIESLTGDPEKLHDAILLAAQEKGLSLS